MDTYNKVDTKLNFVEREEKVLEFWTENKIFEKSVEMRADREFFTFYDGPPTANGMPHIGHVLTRAIKDIVPRYKTMKGYQVLRKAGWDTHGLPVELEIEKMLGISGKPEIEKYGIESFVEKCKESVWKYEKEWRVMSNRVGFWADMDNPYVTYHDDYIESVWWSLKTIFDKGLIYKGHKIVPYCPRCGTSLSTHEVAQGYKDVKEKSAIAKFKLVDEENTSFLAWTTTPWTLPSNVALVVNPKESYVKVKVNDEYFILAEALVDKVIEDEFEVVEKYIGTDLEYKKYKPLYNYGEFEEDAYYVCVDTYVTLTDGTGIVHTAPAFGEDDAVVGRKYGLPFLQLVDTEGKFVECVEKWAGVFVKDADLEILKDLDASGLLYKALNYEHSYPFCWRCDTPLLYYANSTWFIEMTKVRDNLVKNNQTVNWLPDNFKEGRFGKWLEGVRDWALSRTRYWGTPLPIWTCDDCGHIHAIGSKEELKAMSPNCPEDIELHKPYIDRVNLTCPKCSKNMTRVPEVIDGWFDSGAMPFAQWHYPFENKELFENQFPANFISEAQDQTRGWFYTLMAISTILFDKSPYENVVVLGLVQDEHGQKMSKHKGNGVSPEHALNTQGADAVRWYFYSNSNPWLPSKYSDAAVEEGQRKFMGTLWNTYAFYILYANIDNFNPMEHTLDKDKLDVMDKWILSKLNTLVQTVDTSLEAYGITEGARAMSSFVDDLSNWYVRRSRERFWANGMPQEKVNAFMTLHTVLVTMSKLAAPFIPFITDEIYRNLVCSIDKNAPISVHLTDYPVYDESFVDSKLEEEMDTVLKIVGVGRSARNTANIKNRQPIGTMYVKSKEQVSGSMLDIVKDELNLKTVEFVENTEKFVTYTFKPQLRTLGKKYGKLVPAIAEHLKTVDGNEFMNSLKAGNVAFEVLGESVELSIDDVLYEEAQKEGYASETENNITAILDIVLSEELLEEGYVREVISKVQTMRKESDFEVMDKIVVTFKGTEKIENVISKNQEFIANEVLADKVVLEDTSTKEWNINGEALFIDIKKV
ncbi:MAG: isoleucine--tRNA ligase [Lachnospirales bacterium]